MNRRFGLGFGLGQLAISVESDRQKRHANCRELARLASVDDERRDADRDEIGLGLLSSDRAEQGGGAVEPQGYRPSELS